MVGTQSGGPAKTVFMDTNVAASDWAKSWLAKQENIGIVHRLEAVPTLDAVECCAGLLAEDPEQDVVAIGGGALLDTVRLARLWYWGGDLVRLALTRGRQGYVALADSSVEGVLRAIPTTLGTGAERSCVACVIAGGRRRLVLSPALRADEYSYEPGAYASLPIGIIRDSVLEVVLRVMGPYIMNGPHPPTDDMAVDVVREALGLWPRVRERTPEALHRLAELSGQTHDSAWARGRGSFTTPLWYLANELSSACGISKMDAHVALLPTFLRRVCTSGGPWGSASRLEEFLDRVTPETPQAEERTDLRATRVFAPIVGPTPQLAVNAAALGLQTFSHWGGGLPALGSLRRAEIEDFFREALSTEEALR